MKPNDMENDAGYDVSDLFPQEHEIDTKQTHTPGPWFVNGPWHIQAESGISGYRANGEPIPALPKILAQVIRGSGVSQEEMEANARLIAAAPALLASCKELLDNLHCADCVPEHGHMCSVCTQARAAIAQAGNSI